MTTSHVWLRCLLGWHKWYWTYPKVHMPLSGVDIQIKRGLCEGPGCRATKEVLPREAKT